MQTARIQVYGLNAPRGHSPWDLFSMKYGYEGLLSLEFISSILCGMRLRFGLPLLPALPVSCSFMV